MTSSSSSSSQLLQLLVVVTSTSSLLFFGNYNNLLPFVILSLAINLASALLYAIPFKSEQLFDLTGSITFIVLLLTSLAHSVYLDIRYSFMPIAHWKTMVMVALVTVWTARLGWFLWRRMQRHSIDPRFELAKCQPLRFVIFYLLQAWWCVLMLLPVLMMNRQLYLRPSLAFHVTLLDVVGLTAWLVGFGVEVVADAQKATFRHHTTATRLAKKTSEASDSSYSSFSTSSPLFITTGCWAYSRHPNYVGEILLWIGIYLFCFSGMTTLRDALLAAVSPVTILVLLLGVSGIPLLEAASDEKYKSCPHYQRYKASTPILLPWFSSKTKAS